MSQFQKNVLFIGAIALVLIAISFGINLAIQEHARSEAERKIAWMRDNIRSLKSLSVLAALSPEEQTRVDNVGDDAERLQQVLLEIHEERCAYWRSQLEEASDNKRTWLRGDTSYTLLREMIQSAADDEKKARTNLQGFEQAETQIRAWRPSKFEDYRPGSTGVARPVAAMTETSGIHWTGKRIKWTAMSHTASAITGDIETSPGGITMANNTYPFISVRQLHGDELQYSAKVLSADDATSASIEGQVSRISIPASAHLINGSTICGTDSAEWVLILTTSMEGTGPDAGNWLYLAFFSGDAEPVIQTQALKNSKALCGTYNYHEIASMP